MEIITFLLLLQLVRVFSLILYRVLRWLLRVIRTYIPGVDQWIERVVTPRFNRYRKKVGRILFLVLVVLAALIMIAVNPIAQVVLHFLYSRQRQIAKEINTDPEELRKLAKCPDLGTRRAVVSNPNTSPEVLLKLGEQFPSDLLANPVFDLMLLEDPAWLRTMPRATLKRILQQKHSPKYLLEQAAAIDGIDVEMIRIIAQHPNASEQVLQRIAAHQSDEDVRRSLLQRSDLSSALLKQLANYDSD